ncbi:MULTISPECIES: hypothetical protein [unclassified Tenacibaculum]|uniref:hypothetical protein n=1 Tax=unclassified Tenacibaculum TaxID=2635139 RepID=UPI001F2B524A|nr:MULTISPECIES: hypothetical protein [unclassified Tenacibaculum]MCF2874071.1 hypothetical protein [Tenacibaculum sp. Cn5-1]MCF2934652.1 hypothetical protein [Tenacibaculum sp. Cn5-34]MCG7510862.1 hypothetical protein [Tenacibaculum sp. Cn5-46]
MVFNKAKKENAIALKKVKNYAKNTEVYNEYKNAYAKKKAAFNKLKTEISNQKVFGFDSSHYFWERLGRNIVDILFSLFAVFLVVNFISVKKNKIFFWGSLLVVLIYLSTKLFILYWVFKQFQDYSLAAYFFVTFISSLLIVSVMFLLVRYVKSEEVSLKSNLLDLAKFTFKNTKPEKREEMLDLIKEIARTNK